MTIFVFNVSLQLLLSVKSGEQRHHMREIPFDTAQNGKLLALFDDDMIAPSFRTTEQARNTENHMGQMNVPALLNGD